MFRAPPASTRRRGGGSSSAPCTTTVPAAGTPFSSHHTGRFLKTYSSTFHSQEVGTNGIAYCSSASFARQHRRQRHRRSTVVAAAAADTAPAGAPTDDAEDGGATLERLLGFLIANGVRGLDGGGARAAIYEEPGTGERGVVAVRPIAAGEDVFVVPLRLAITDSAADADGDADADGNSAADADADSAAAAARLLPLWQDRLAAKLLRLRAAGAASPWARYLAALPRRVPSALDAFPSIPGAAEAVEHAPAVARIEGHPALMRAKWEAVSGRRPELIGGADLEAFRWAHTCVMSRTFGNAAPGGGIGVRMLVPLVDMLNHAGDRTAGLLSGEAFATDNVRWDVRGPASAANATGGWEMAVSATRDVDEGEPLLLSYFEGSNDEFLLHYGFVPPCNPHDEVELAPGLAAALEALWAADAAAAVKAGGEGGGGGGGLAALEAAYAAALAAGREALRQEVEEAAARMGGGAGGGSPDADMDAAVYADLAAGLEVVKVASGSRISNSLVAALEALAGAGSSGGAAPGVDAEFLVAALCRRALRAMPTPLPIDLAALLLDAAARRESGDDAEAVHEAAAAAEQLQHYAALLGAAGGGAGGDSSGSSSPEDLARSILRAAAAGGAAPDAERLAAPPLEGWLRSAVSYRACKKMQLVDVIAAVAAARGAPVAELEQQLAAWAARGDGARAPPPPWRAF